jgi:hypothetical protein
MELSGKLHVPTALSQGENLRKSQTKRPPGPHSLSGSFGEEKNLFRSITDIFQRNKINSHCQPTDIQFKFSFCCVNPFFSGEGPRSRCYGRNPSLDAYCATL